uniref:ADAM metallopeptidase domain 19 n=1 Tax=Myripristis murdjan TaxID=586833 RepID=A0A668AV54_9TELE
VIVFYRQLLAPGYQEIWYSPSGTRLSSSPGHCFYHGEVLGVEGSSVAVSTCSGLRGLISLNTSVSYLIEPLPVSTDTQQHAVFRAESLHLPKGSCLHHHGNKEEEEEEEQGLNTFIHGMMTPWSVRVSPDRRMSRNHLKYVHIFHKAEQYYHHMFRSKHGRHLEKTKMKLLEAANYVDKVFFRGCVKTTCCIIMTIFTSVSVSLSDSMSECCFCLCAIVHPCLSTTSH